MSALPAGAVAALLLVSAIDRPALPPDGAALVEVETLDVDAVSTDATPAPVEYSSGDGSEVPDGDHAVSADVPISL